MIARPRGIYRTEEPPGVENDAMTEDSGGRRLITESMYRANGYDPPFDRGKLPTRAEWEAVLFSVLNPLIAMPKNGGFA